jgi:hypothetical protein
MNKSNESRVDYGNSTMRSVNSSSFQNDYGLGGMTMEKFARERLIASLKPASAENGVPRPAVVTKLKPTTPLVRSTSKLEAFSTITHDGL